MKCYSLCLSAIAVSLVIPNVSSASSEAVRVTTEWTSRCKHDEQAATAQAVGAVLIAIMAPLAVSAAIDAAGSAIEASAKENTVTRVAKTSYSNFYKVTKTALTSLDRNCLVVTSAKYSEDGLKNDGAPEKEYMTIEISIQKIKGYPLYRLVPVYLNVVSFEDSSFWSRERRIDFNITLKGVGEGIPFASSVISFFGVRSGLKLEKNDARLAGAAGDAFTLPNLSDVDDVKAKFAPNARKLVFAMKYLENGGVSDDYKVESDVTSIFARENMRKAVYQYCKGLEVGISDSICANWWQLGAERVALQKKMFNAERDPALIQARKDWAHTICPNYNTKAGLISCPEGSDRAAAGFFSTNVAVVSVRDSNKYGLALASVLSKSSTKIGEVAASYLPDNKRAQNNITEEASRVADQKVYISIKEETLAQALLDEVQSSGSASKADLQKAELDLLIAMTKTNDAYVAAGRLPPHTSL